MTEIVIRDVPIRFPFKPYKVQEDYMSKVLECLQQRMNGVLESPTGTGKTLSLLCSSLAWLQTKKAELQANGLSLNSNDSQQSFSINLKSTLEKAAGNASQEDAVWSSSLGTPQIIYASRTHSQLTQVMKELKRTSYSHIKAAILGSRDQLCLHPDLSQEQGYMKIAMCRAKVSAKSCHFHNNLDSKRHDESFLPKEVVDIEDLVKFGNRTQCCSYFMAREMMNTADIIFMPYNYLLNPQTRRVQRINLSNAVVILDEAHNVERMCEESASVQISSTDIALCIAEVTQVMKKFADEINTESGEETVKDFSAEDLYILKTMFLALEAAIDEIQLKTVTYEGHDKGKKSLTMPGSFIFDLLLKAEIQVEKLPVIDNALTNLAQFLSTTSESPLSRKGSMLVRFNEFLKVVFASTGERGNKDQSDLFYKVYIEPEMPKKGKPDSWSSTKTTVNSKAKVINFWCFSPGFAMRSLLNQGIHCVILTSGTLSPLHATVSELGIPIPVQLENPHIIEPSQVSVTVLSKGPTNENLTSSYSNRDNPNYLSDLGRILTNFCRVIPDGVLLFFPSYPMMEKTVNYWQQEGIWSQINTLKPLYVEPQRRDGLADVMRDYTQALEAEGSRGAVFLAVLRGKVSEGMDFADSRCRAVIVTGLPFPPFKDARVVLKRVYADQLRKNNPKALSGREWYDLEAARAVNQAVGRVIRHGSDFGAILLCDNRFESPVITNTLSAWLRPYIVKCKQFGPAFARVSKFFKALGLNPPLRAVEAGASFDYVDSTVRIKEITEEQTQKENNDASFKQLLEKFRQTQPKAPQPSPNGLLDALDIPSQSKAVNILKAVYDKPQEEEEAFVQPTPKKRKLKIVPLKFDDASSETVSAQTSGSEKRAETNKDYLLQVKSRLNNERFALFKESVKNYAYNKDSDYNNMLHCLRKIFPDSATKDLFIGFKRYIKAEHMAQFESLCRRKYGVSS